MENKKVYLLIASAEDANVNFFGSQLVETIEKQEERLAQLSKDGQLAEFAQATYGHARFLIEEIGQVQYHQRWDYLNFAALCCLRVVDCPKHKCTFEKTLYDNIKDVLRQLYLLIDESR